MAKLVTTTALLTFTRFVEGYGQVHGDPESSLGSAKKPELPEHLVQAFVDAELVSAKGFKVTEPAAAEEAAEAEPAADEAP